MIDPLAQFGLPATAASGAVPATVAEGDRPSEPKVPADATGGSFEVLLRRAQKEMTAALRPDAAAADPAVEPAGGSDLPREWSTGQAEGADAEQVALREHAPPSPRSLSGVAEVGAAGSTAAAAQATALSILPARLEPSESGAGLEPPDRTWRAHLPPAIPARMPGANQGSGLALPADGVALRVTSQAPSGGERPVGATAPVDRTADAYEAASRSDARRTAEDPPSALRTMPEDFKSPPKGEATQVSAPAPVWAHAGATLGGWRTAAEQGPQATIDAPSSNMSADPRSAAISPNQSESLRRPDDPRRIGPPAAQSREGIAQFAPAPAEEPGSSPDARPFAQSGTPWAIGHAEAPAREWRSILSHDAPEIPRRENTGGAEGVPPVLIDQDAPREIEPDVGTRSVAQDRPGYASATPVRAAPDSVSSAARADRLAAWQPVALGPAVDLVVGPEQEPGSEETYSFALSTGMRADALERLFGTPRPPARVRVAGDAMNLQEFQRTAEPAVSVSRLTAATAGPSRDSAAFEVISQVPDPGPAQMRPGSDMPRAVWMEVPREEGQPFAQAVTAMSHAAPGAVADPQTNRGQQPPVSYAQMAERIAWAVSSRMASAWREGDASLRVQLDPPALGPIEVEMALQEGRLEATITAPQTVARELLAEGLGRLRETLGQLGMNVAQITLSDGLSARSDGKPTRHRTGEAAYSRLDPASAEEGIAADGRRMRPGPSNLDVWA